MGESGDPRKQPRPDAGPQPVQIVPKQITYPQAQVEVQSGEDGSRALIFLTAFETLIFPMGPEAAQAIGRKLSSTLIVPEVNMPVGKPV